MKFDLKKIKSKRVHCDTEEKADALLKFLHENGYEWISGGSLIKENYWNNYKQNTYYCIHKRWGEMGGGGIGCVKVKYQKGA